MTVTHACPVGDAAVTPCCFRSPFELLGDRMTLAAELVTCGRPVEPVDAEAIAMRLVNATPGPWGIEIMVNAREDLGALLRERGSLVDRLDEAETKLAFLASSRWLLTRDELLQRVTAVRALHYERDAGERGLLCREDEQRWPCKTARALQ